MRLFGSVNKYAINWNVAQKEHTLVLVVWWMINIDKHHWTMRSTTYTTWVLSYWTVHVHMCKTLAKSITYSKSLTILPCNSMGQTNILSQTFPSPRNLSESLPERNSGWMLSCEPLGSGSGGTGPSVSALPGRNHELKAPTLEMKNEEKMTWPSNQWSNCTCSEQWPKHIFHSSSPFNHPFFPCSSSKLRLVRRCSKDFTVLPASVEAGAVWILLVGKNSKRWFSPELRRSVAKHIDHRW